MAQTAGDYRTAASGNWNNTATWERYDGVTWIANPAVPTSADGAIAIRNGHNVTLTAPVTADQLTVETGGTLTLSSFGNNLTINDGAGTDLTVDGTLALGPTNITASPATATAVINGTFNWTDGTMAINTTASATATVNLSGNVQKNINNSTFTNDGVMNWATGASSGGIFFNSGHLINNGTINEQFQSNRGFSNASGTNSFVNNGTFNKTTANAFANLAVPFTNSSTGILKGTGLYNLNGTISNTGTVAPGNSPGALTVNPAVITGQTPTLSFEIDGGTPVTEYDQLTVNNPVNITGSNLVVTETNSHSPLQTYTIMNAASISGTFASVTIPINYTLNYTSGGTTVSVTKNSFSLPLTWGDINAVAEGSVAVRINFSTLQEIETASFVIEHSTDGANFTAAGYLPAAGNSGTTLKYSFVHNSPSLSTTNFYRIKQFDINGHFTYSKTIVFRFHGNTTKAVILKENPVKTTLNFTVLEEDLRIRLTDLSGRQVVLKNVQPGAETLDMSNYPGGLYILSVYKNAEMVQQLKVIKQ
jgi:hypothetical protein